MSQFDLFFYNLRFCFFHIWSFGVLSNIIFFTIIFKICKFFLLLTIWLFKLSHNFSFWVLSMFELLNFVTNWFYFYFVTITFFVLFLVIQKRVCEQKEWKKNENRDKKKCEEEENKLKKLGANVWMVFYQWGLLCLIHKAREAIIKKLLSHLWQLSMIAPLPHSWHHVVTSALKGLAILYSVHMCYEKTFC